MTCMACGRTLDETARSCSGCGRPTTIGAPRYPAMDRLIRPREGRMIAGICAGFALRYDWDVALVRLVLVLAVIFGAGTPILAYLIAWVVIPNGQYGLPAQTGPGPDSMAV